MAPKVFSSFVEVMDYLIGWAYEHNDEPLVADLLVQKAQMAPWDANAVEWNGAPPQLKSIIGSIVHFSAKVLTSDQIGFLNSQVR